MCRKQEYRSTAQQHGVDLENTPSMRSHADPVTRAGGVQESGSPRLLGISEDQQQHATLPSVHAPAPTQQSPASAAAPVPESSNPVEDSSPGPGVADESTTPVAVSAGEPEEVRPRT